MPVLYDGSKIIPIETADVSRQFNRSEDETIIGKVYNITLKGRILAYKGSPTSTGTFWTSTGYPPDETITSDYRLKSLLNKREALDCLFSHDGRLLEIQPWDGSAPMKCNPRMKGDIQWAPGPWTDYMEFTVQMEADHIFNNLNPDCPMEFDEKISDAQDEWQFESNENQTTFRLSHNLSAKGKKTYDVNGVVIREAWQEAQAWVQQRLGIDADRVTASGLVNLPSYYIGYNYIRGETVGKLNGNYSATENWLLSSGNITEEFTVETRTGIENGLTQTSVQGTVTGLESRNNTTWVGPSETKYTAASGQFFYNIQPILFSRAQQYAGVTLNPVPTNQTIGRNPPAGTITYNFDYDNRPAQPIDGALSTIITVNDDLQHDLFAVIPVIGRPTGPVLQDIGTQSEKRRTLTIEVVMPAQTYGSGTPTEPNVESIVSVYTPSAGQLYRSDNQKTWTPFGTSPRLTRNISWTYE